VWFSSDRHEANYQSSSFFVIEIADVISNGFSNKKGMQLFLLSYQSFTDVEVLFFLPPDFSLVKDQIMDIRLE